MPRVVPATGRPVVVPVKPTPELVDVHTPVPDCSTPGRAWTDAAVAAGAADITGSAAETTVALMIIARFIWTSCRWLETGRSRTALGVASLFAWCRLGAVAAGQFVICTSAAQARQTARNAAIGVAQVGPRRRAANNATTAAMTAAATAATVTACASYTVHRLRPSCR